MMAHPRSAFGVLAGRAGPEALPFGRPFVSGLSLLKGAER